MNDSRTPLEKVETLYHELVDWYGEEASDRELRAASKLLMVALSELRKANDFGWQGIVHEYMLMLRNDPERFERVLDSHRGETKHAIQ
ncbi:MAG: hypothetical protein ACPGU7_10225 [Gammaproteobacteria bacterium]